MIKEVVTALLEFTQKTVRARPKLAIPVLKIQGQWRTTRTNAGPTHEEKSLCR